MFISYLYKYLRHAEGIISFIIIIPINSNRTDLADFVLIRVLIGEGHLSLQVFTFCNHSKGNMVKRSQTKATMYSYHCN